jgi:hypothetical protein
MQASLAGHEQQLQQTPTSHVVGVMTAALHNFMELKPGHDVLDWFLPHKQHTPAGCFWTEAHPA